MAFLILPISQRVVVRLHDLEYRHHHYNPASLHDDTIFESIYY
nr:hypothetical protein [uncultured Capnocytophaga sp.]